MTRCCGTCVAPPRAVREAIELLETYPDRAWFAPALASQVHVSVRALQEGFQRALDTTPMRYLRDVRLRRVREDLLDAVAMYTDADGPAVTPGTLTLRLDHLRAGVPVVHASGCLDHVTASSLQHLLDDQLAAAPWAIVIDLSALSVLKPDAVPTLVHVACRARETDIGLCLVTADHTVNGAFATAGVDELFEIYPTTEAVLHALG